MYSMMLWDMLTLWNDSIELINICITLHNYHPFVVKTLKIHSQLFSSTQHIVRNHRHHAVQIISSTSSPHWNFDILWPYLPSPPHQSISLKFSPLSSKASMGRICPSCRARGRAQSTWRVFRLREHDSSLLRSDHIRWTLQLPNRGRIWR